MKIVSSYDQVLLEEGRQEGVQQGLQQGVQQGLQQGSLGVLELVLETKFGRLEEPLRERLKGLNTAQLEKMAVAFLTFTNINDVVQWLNEQSV